MEPFSHKFQAIPFVDVTDPLKLFFQTRGRYSNFQKETFFLRYIASQSFPLWAEMCHSWENSESGYIYVEHFPNRLDPVQAVQYRELCNQGELRPSFRFQNALWNDAFMRAWEEVLLLFQQVRNCKEASIINNFAIKLLFWMDNYFPKLFVETNKMTKFPKFVCSGTIGTSEYLFLYLLYCLGCDVLYLGKENDVDVSSPQLASLSRRVEQISEIPVQMKRTENSEMQQRPTILRSALRRADREQPNPSQNSVHHPQQNTFVPEASAPATGKQQEMDFEQLAQFASSVVMLKVFDEENNCFKTGSGIIISSQGYILTNFHVVSGGSYYGILVEEESDTFYTNELIKYHAEWDLAILRFNKYRTPIPILSTSEQIRRGQKVVAIGSPLGLFNTVSDGIVSGFRELRETSMVQFTAPISHGSSGGALLDLYGRLIGVITAGFDDGQNLNLAVDHRTILQFIGNLIS